MSKRRLGKGIDALLQGRDLEQLSNISSITMVDIGDISANPDQPRKRFSDDSLQQLAESIANKGIIQPIIAEDRGDGSYIIIAGERRYRAAQLAGLQEVPIISQEFSDDEKLEIALIENIQREDLNPVDEARALKQIIEHSGDTQEEVAKRLGKSRAAVSNAIRTLSLDDTMLDALSEGTISSGHARALLRVSDPGKRTALFELILEKEISVRSAEAIAGGGKPAPEDLADHPDSLNTEPDAATTLPDPNDTDLVPGAGGANGTDGSGATKSVELQRIEELLIHRFGSRAIVRGSDQKGRVEFPYGTTEELEQLLDAMGVDLSQT